MNKQHNELHKLLDAYYSAAVDHCACGGDCGTKERLNSAEEAIERLFEPFHNDSQKIWLLMGSDGEPITFYTEFPSGSEFKASMVLKPYLLVPVK